MSVNNHRKCAKCGKTRGEDMTVSYHRFPNPGTTNITKARAWAKYCWPNEDWTSVELLRSLYNKNKVLCGRHFNSTQFIDNKRQKLSKFAVPESIIVEELLNERENIFHQNVDQSSVGSRQPKLPLPMLQQENVMMEPSTSAASLKQQTIESISIMQNVDQSSVGSRQPKLPLPMLQQENVMMEPSTSAASLKQQTIESISIMQNAPNTKNLSVVTCSKEKSAKKQTKVLANLGVTKVSEMTPRKMKLYKICRNKMREVIRLRNKIKNKKQCLKRFFENEQVQEFYNLNISNSFITLLQSQLKNCPKKPKGRRYSLNEKIQALVIYKKSPSCYRLLRRMFALPSQSILNQLINKVPLKPGINQHIFTSLAKMSQRQDKEDNICILLFDEMSIRKHLFYDQKLDEIQGFQDHGNHGRSHDIASKALVFMLAGLRKKWKQPIAFYFSHTLKADRMAIIIKEILTQCIAANMNVVGTVCDLSAINVKALKILGATSTSPFFYVCEQEIVAIFDPPHLLKCTRNLLIKHDIEITSDFQCNEKPIKGIVKWSHIEAFYKLDKNNPNFVYAPQLTDHHLHPNCQQRMRVKLAAQVFSHSVTSGMLMKIAQNELPAEAHATATFVQKFDELFDAVNADSPDLRRGKKYSTNLRKNTPHLVLFKNMRRFISNMKYIGSKSNPPSQEGWIHTLNAIERLWNNLQAVGIKSLSTRRLNQDPLENCFSCIRYSCGSNHNPTINQFIAGIKTAIITNLKHAGQKRNCEDDTALIANNLSSFLAATISSSHDSNMATFQFDENKEMAHLLSDAVEAVEQGTSESQACGYVCGFIFKKLKHNNCLDCQKAFLSDSQEITHMFTSFKEYDSSHNSLNYVRKDMVTCVETMANIINDYLKTNAYQTQLKLYIIKALDCVNCNFLNECTIHLELNENHLKISTFFIVIKRYCVLINRDMDDEEKKKSYERKMKILKNK